MSDPDAPQERPHYWDECKAMSFGQLREFVDRALDAIRNGKSQDGQPNTKLEFVALADMLDSKIDESRDEVPPIPPVPESPPGYDPAIPGRSRGDFYWSRELNDLRMELDHQQWDLEDARHDPDVPRWRFDHMRQEVRELRRRVEKQEEEEKRTWPERYAAHAKVAPAHRRSLQLRVREVAEIEKRLGILDRQREFVGRIRRTIESVCGASDGVFARKV